MQEIRLRALHRAAYGATKAPPLAFSLFCFGLRLAVRHLMAGMPPSMATMCALDLLVLSDPYRFLLPRLQ